MSTQRRIQNSDLRLVRPMRQTHPAHQAQSEILADVRQTLRVHLAPSIIFTDVSLEKSVFHVKTVDFLAYVVATNGVTMNEKKVETIQAWKPPTLVREVQILMGLAKFYWRFIKNISDICTPITNWTKGDRTKFVWGKDQQEDFKYLKQCFTTAPILCHFHTDRDTVVETDASDYACGCILSQFQEKRLHPVIFHSRKLNSAE